MRAGQTRRSDVQHVATDARNRATPLSPPQTRAVGRGVKGKHCPWIVEEVVLFREAQGQLWLADWEAVIARSETMMHAREFRRDAFALKERF